MPYGTVFDARPRGGMSAGEACAEFESIVAQWVRGGLRK